MIKMKKKKMMMMMMMMMGRRQVGEAIWRVAQQQRCRGRRYATAAEEAAATATAAKGGSRTGGGWRAGSVVAMALFGLASGAAGAAATWQVVRSQGMGFYSDAESIARLKVGEEGTGEDVAEARRVYETIEAHPLVAELRGRSDLTESRPHLKMPAQVRQHSLTGWTLAGPGRVPVPAVAWTEAGGKGVTLIVYAGRDLCGHPGLVHGGFLATLLDESLAWCCFDALPYGIGVTARLAIDYRKPTPADNFLVVRARTERVEGRKAWVKGQVELLAPAAGYQQQQQQQMPTVLAEAEALYVSPRHAALMPRLR